MAEENSGKSFQGVNIELDGNSYRHCTFRECRLIYRGGTPPTLISNHIEGCKFEFSDAAGRTVEFLRGLRNSGDGQELVNAIVEGRQVR